MWDTLVDITASIQRHAGRVAAIICRTGAWRADAAPGRRIGGAHPHPSRSPPHGVASKQLDRRSGLLWLKATGDGTFNYARSHVLASSQRHKLYCEDDFRLIRSAFPAAPLWHFSPLDYSSSSRTTRLPLGVEDHNAEAEGFPWSVRINNPYLTKRWLTVDLWRPARTPQHPVESPAHCPSAERIFRFITMRTLTKHLTPF